MKRANCLTRLQWDHSCQLTNTQPRAFIAARLVSKAKAKSETHVRYVSNDNDKKRLQVLAAVGLFSLLHYALSLAVQCIFIGPVCLQWAARAGVICLWVCFHDNSKLRASIFTKLGLYVKAVTISSWLYFGHPMPPGRGSAVGQKLLASPYYSQRTVFASLLALSSFTTEFGKQSFSYLHT